MLYIWFIWSRIIIWLWVNNSVVWSNGIVWITVYIAFAFLVTHKFVIEALTLRGKPSCAIAASKSLGVHFALCFMCL